MITGKLHSVETFGAVDGPGIRTVFFMQGCPARCIYCHNPDTWPIGIGDTVKIKEIVERAKRGRPYYGEDGGVTFSGGEPLLQGEFIIEAMKALKKESIGSVIDTSGTYFDKFTKEAINQAELVLLDIKHTDPRIFTEMTQMSQEPLYEVIAAVNALRKPIWVRQVIVPGINDTEKYILSLKEFLKCIKTVAKVELLGYHNMAVPKYEKLGIPYKLKDVDPMNRKKLEKFKKILDK